ncbi:MAG: hypothetical protein HC920_12925 [Oscillatoriales cyanobacterium SM2_3_0]|nr:hypothetical protein [Oscillatoriales cyanobacterium SM2_3_0]
MHNTRLILYHKQPTSARILFCRWQGTTCLFDGLPADGTVTASRVEDEPLALTPIPNSLIPEIEERLQLTDGDLRQEKDFQAVVSDATGTTDIYLAQLAQTDAPHGQMARIEAKLIPITEARTLPAIELKLLGLVYAFLMDG